MKIPGKECARSDFDKKMGSVSRSRRDIPCKMRKSRVLQDFFAGTAQKASTLHESPTHDTIFSRLHHRQRAAGEGGKYVEACTADPGI